MAAGCRMTWKKNVMQFIRIKSAHHKKVPYQKLWQQLSSFWQPIWRKITNSDKFSWSSLWLYQNRFLWESKLGYKSKTFATGFYFLPLKSSGFSFFQSNHKPAQNLRCQTVMSSSVSANSIGTAHRLRKLRTMWCRRRKIWPHIYVQSEAILSVYFISDAAG